MDTLLGQVLDAHGGLERWRRHSKVEATIVTGGGFFPLKGLMQDLNPRRMTVWLHEERSSITPFGAPDQRTMFTPDRIAIEKLDGTLVAERYAPRDSFAGHQMHTPWDPLHRAYFNGEAVWTYLTTPFLLAMDGGRRTPFPFAGLSRYNGSSRGLGQAMKAGGGPTRPRSRATTAKRRPEPKAARGSRSAKAKIESPANAEAEQLALELQEARERQAATAEVLSLISHSPTGIQPVFDRIIRNAARLRQSVLSAVYRREGDNVHLVAYDQFSPESIAAVRKAYPAPLTSKNLISVAIRERRVVHEADVLVSGGYSELQKTSGYRSILVVPMLRDDVAIGAIAVMRLEPKLFPKAQVELLKTFAGQAVIAIENTRLFTELQERTTQLSQSLDDLRTAQDGLIQTEKLAALGRLVAGVAHELNTPVGTSLTVASAFINKADRLEADIASGGVRRSSLTEFIASSREAASQIMINLNHAVDLIQSFKQVATDRNISDRRGFDLAQVTEQVVKGLRFGLRRNLVVNVACEPDLAMNSYPGPYGQVLTNLVINSAVHAYPDGAHGAVHIAAQASGKHNVEVLFTDDGCGMSPEIRRQVFDPFFTTRRDQGSTGLGLHIVHNIVTNRLGGRINLETRPGAGTKIRIVMPREAPLAAAAE